MGTGPHGARRMSVTSCDLMVTGLQTRASLVRQFRSLGLRPGQTVLLHSSLRSLGWVCGGARTVVLSLLDVLGAGGTLVVPAFTPENRDPSRWADPAIPAEWWPAIRRSLPPYDPATSSCRSLGLIAETVRTWPGAARSPHPQTSFAAVGARAESLTARHDLDCELGEESPLAALEAAGAYVLLLGVGYDRCTALHLAEYRLPWRTPRDNACVMSTPSGRRWVRYVGVQLSIDGFDELGADFEQRPGAVAVGPVGAATARLLPLPEVVGFAVDWLIKNRRS